MSLDFINLYYDRIVQLLGGGFTNLRGISINLIFLALILSAVGFVVSLISGKIQDMGINISGLIISTAIWYIVFFYLPALAQGLFRFMHKVGMQAGGGEYTSGVGITPGGILAHGLELIKPLGAKFLDVGIRKIVSSLVYFVAYILLLFSFIFIMIQYILTTIEFYIGITISAIVVPLAFWAPSKPIAENCIKFLFSQGIKVALIVFIYSISITQFQEIGKMLESDLSTELVLVVVGMAITTLMLTRYIPQVASAVLTGQPVMSNAMLGAALAGVAGGIAMAARGAKTAGSLAKGSATNLGKMVKSGVGAGLSGASAAKSLGNATKAQKFKAAMSASGKSLAADYKNYKRQREAKKTKSYDPTKTGKDFNPSSTQYQSYKNWGARKIQAGKESGSSSLEKITKKSVIPKNSKIKKEEKS